MLRRFDVFRTANPDVMVIWDMPVAVVGISYKSFDRRVCFRSPDAIILLTAGADRLRVTEAVQLGVHEFKPTSPGALRDRLASFSSRARWSKLVNITCPSCAERLFSTIWMRVWSSDQDRRLRNN